MFKCCACWKFSARVRPTGGERPLNLIEQVNQTLTSLARLQAALGAGTTPELLVQGVCVHLGPRRWSVQCRARCDSCGGVCSQPSRAP